MDSNFIFYVVSFIAFFFALTIHEFSHALSAYYYGDRTAQHAGRLTLNPLAHIDLFGTILLPVMLILSQMPIVIGWAKPVPVNYYNLRNQKWGPAVVSLFGPLANLIFGFISLILLALVLKFSNLPATNLLVIFLQFLAQINLVLMVFNLLPIPPLDGSKILFALLPAKYDNFKQIFEQFGVFFLLFFLVIGTGIVFGIANWIFLILARVISLFI